MVSVGIITVSDRSSKGLREDLSGPAIRQWALEKGYTVTKEIIVPDEYENIKNALLDFSNSAIDLIVTTGGTGFAPRDVTPEATLAVIEKQAPGFAEVMRMKSYQVTSHAMLSRAVSGIRKKSLIINLPGSPKAVRENLGFMEDAIPHAIELLQSKVTDCGSGE
jgi:molybdenum cofactor synthesis domain-containing protein